MAHVKASSETDEEEKKQKWDILVKGGSKIRNIISQALGLLQKEEKIVLIGMGPTVTRAITCAEIVKRKVKNLHQNNKLFYSKTGNIWEPKESDQQVDKLQVTRRVPAISITLSTVPLAPAEPGYQVPGQYRSPVQFWKDDITREEEKNERKEHKMKRRRHSDEEREHRDSRKGGQNQHERSQGHNKSRFHKRTHKPGGRRGDALDEERSGAQAGNLDQSPGSAERTPRKRGGHHGGSKSRHYSQNKKQKGEASALKRSRAKTQPTAENPPSSVNHK